MKKYKVRDKVNKTSWKTIEAESALDSAVIYFKSQESVAMAVEVVDPFGNISSYELPLEIEQTEEKKIGKDEVLPLRGVKESGDGGWSIWLKHYDKKFDNLNMRMESSYQALNHIRWIGLSIGGMFALTFIIPQCTSG